MQKKCPVLKTLPRYQNWKLIFHQGTKPILGCSLSNIVAWSWFPPVWALGRGIPSLLHRMSHNAWEERCVTSRRTAAKEIREFSELKKSFQRHLMCWLPLMVHFHGVMCRVRKLVRPVGFWSLCSSNSFKGSHTHSSSTVVVLILTPRGRESHNTEQWRTHFKVILQQWISNATHNCIMS